MLKQNILASKAPYGSGLNNVRQIYSSIHRVIPTRLCPFTRDHVRAYFMRATTSHFIISARLDFLGCSDNFQPRNFKVVATENPGELFDEDDELCPAECVREFKTDDEFFKILEKAKETDSLVVVDFYRTSCGSCKYIEQGFAKLCRGAGDKEASVIFLKHNVVDEYDEQSEVAERLRIKTVPLFHFYKDGNLLESFATRDKERIDAAISKYTSPASSLDA